MRMLLADADNKSGFEGKSAHLYGCADFFYSVTYFFKTMQKESTLFFMLRWIFSFQACIRIFNAVKNGNNPRVKNF